MTRTVVVSALVGSMLGLACAVVASVVWQPLDTLTVGLVAGVGAGSYAAVRTWREGKR